MRIMGRATFKKIAGLVTGKSGHTIKPRRSVVSQSRASRMKSLGVRPLSSSSRMERGYVPPDQQELYRQAYKALKNSNKPWATESEIKAILDGNKEMSHARSSEVIEILRKARVKGFRETDEVTSGTVYSERMMIALKKAQKAEARSARRATIKKVMDKDQRSISTMDIDPGAHKDTNRATGTKVVKIQSSPTSEAPRYEGSGKKYDDLRQKDHGEPVAHIDTKKKKSSEEEDEEDDDKKEIPFAFDLDDF